MAPRFFALLVFLSTVSGSFFHAVALGGMIVRVIENKPPRVTVEVDYDMSASVFSNQYSTHGDWYISLRMEVNAQAPLPDSVFNWRFVGRHDSKNDPDDLLPAYEGLAKFKVPSSVDDVPFVPQRIVDIWVGHPTLTDPHFDRYTIHQQRFYSYEDGENKIRYTIHGVHVVPEPSSMSVFVGIGLSAIGWRWLRRRRIGRSF